MPLTAGSQQKDYHALTGSEPDADWWISPQDANEGTPGNAVIATQLSDLYRSAYKAATEKTVSAGVLTVDQSSHKIQPQTGTSDDIDTISGMKADTFLVLYVTDEGTDTLTYKHGTGNLSCFGDADITLSHGMITFYYDGAVVYVSGLGATMKTFSVTWTNLSVGNGTVIANYVRIGDCVIATIELVFGSTTSISGAVSWVLPVNAKSTKFLPIGTAMLRNTGIDQYDATPHLQTAGTKGTVVVNKSDGTYVTQSALSSSIPFTWGDTDQLLINMVYIVA